MVSIPKYRNHKSSGLAIVTLPDGRGGRRDFTLGPYGTKASRLEYSRLIAEWEAAGRCLPQISTSDLTLNELMQRFLIHAKAYYRHPDGSQTNEYRDYLSLSGR